MLTTTKPIRTEQTKSISVYSHDYCYASGHQYQGSRLYDFLCSLKVDMSVKSTAQGE